MLQSQGQRYVNFKELGLTIQKITTRLEIGPSSAGPEKVLDLS